MAVLALRVIDRTESRSGKADLSGAALSTLGFGLVIFGITQAPERGWTDAWTIGAILIGDILVATFFRHEARTSQPILPLRLFMDRERASAYAIRFLFTGAMVGFFFSAQVMQEVLGFSPLQARIGFLPMTLVNFAVAMAAPRLIARFGSARLMQVGTALTLVGLFALSRLDTASSYLLGMAVPMLLIGTGQGLAYGPMTASGVARVSASEAGPAAGLVNVSQQIGMSLGISIAVALGISAANGIADTAHHVARAAEVGLGTGSVLMLLAFGVSCLMPRPRCETVPA